MLCDLNWDYIWWQFIESFANQGNIREHESEGDQLLCSANDLVFGVCVFVLPPSHPYTRTRTQFPFHMIFLFLLFAFFPCCCWLQHMPTGLAIKHHAHTNTRRKTIAAKRQSKTHSRTIRIHTLHNFISDKTNGFYMREFICAYRFIFRLNKCVVCVCSCVRASISKSLLFFTLFISVYYFCCHCCCLSLLPLPFSSSSSSASARGLALYR